MKQYFDHLPPYEGKRPRTLTSGGVKEEGQPYPKLYKTSKKAWAAYTETFNKYTADSKAIYWRELPYERKIDDQYVVYSRLYLKKEKT